MARASAVKMPPEASAAHGCEGARRVLALMLAFSAERNTLTARQLADETGIALPSVYRYITLLRETGLLAGDERGSYRLSARLIGMARAAEAEKHFARAIQSAPAEASSHYFYGRWLGQQGRRPEAAAQLRMGTLDNPDYLPASYLLMLFGNR